MIVYALMLHVCTAGGLGFTDARGERVDGVSCAWERRGFYESKQRCREDGKTLLTPSAADIATGNVRVFRCERTKAPK